MEVLIIPDVHLKPWMFEQATEIMRRKMADSAVCLMDIADDWGQESNVGLYIETFDAAIAFAEEFKNSLWCYGNHEMPYLYDLYGPGFSELAEVDVRDRLHRLEDILSDDNRIAYIHKIDNVLFMHGGLSERFVRRYITDVNDDIDYEDADRVIEEINNLCIDDLWHDDTPIWLRPQDGGADMYKPETFLQVVGHTPMREITREGNIISCDVFSTYRSGIHLGTCRFPIINTETWEWEAVQGY